MTATELLARIATLEAQLAEPRPQAHLRISSDADACPICAQDQYRDLVVICPICGQQGGAAETDAIALAFMRAFETARDREMDFETFGTPPPRTQA